MSGAATMFRATVRALALAVPAVWCLACSIPATGGAGERRLELPPGCEALAVPAPNELSFHVYAHGVQIYAWDETSNKWLLKGPEATLYSDADFLVRVGTHFTGPTWQSDGGSSVVGNRLKACTPDPTAIPCLLMSAVTSQGPGPFENTTYIQRLFTKGGLAPSEPGVPGQEVKVPYTAEYFFYRKR